MIHFKKRGAREGYQQIPGIPQAISQLLQIRGISTPEEAKLFLNPSIEDLHDPFLMPGMKKAVEIIHSAIADHKKITIYGDYDVDGVCATSIMLETLEELSANVTFRIPSRHGEGYGLNLNAIREIRKDGTQLLITVDCGVTNLEESLLAKQLGMQVIVTDHHQIGDELPKADAVLNPLLGNYPFPRLCGAGVALKLTQALLGMDGVRKRIDLAAFATVADVVPLIDENRVIVKLGLEKINREIPCHTARKGIECLYDVSKIKLPINSGNIAFQLAPRINAGGRMEDAAQCVEMMTAKDDATAREIAEHLNQENENRKKIEDEIIAEAEEKMAESVDFFSDKAIIIVGKDWNTGIVGLAAGKICEKYHFPTIVLSDTDGIAVGSCRSIPGVNIFRALCGCADLFTRFGGHEMAAGLTIPSKDIPQFRVRLNNEISKICEDEKCYIPVAEYDDEIELKNVTEELIDSLKLFAPTGFGNPGTSFLTRDAEVTMRCVGADNKHLKLQVRDATKIMDGIAFSMGYVKESGIRRADIVFTPEINEFRGQKNPQMQVSCIAQSLKDNLVPSDKVFFEHMMQEISTLAANMNKVCHDEQPCRKVTPAAVHRQIRQGNGRGVLLIAHTAEAAYDFCVETDSDGHQMIDFVQNGEIDVRGFNTLTFPDEIDKLQDVWHTIVFLDGTIKGEIELISQRCSRAEIRVMSSGASVTEKISRWIPDISELRKIYVSVCKNREAISTEDLLDRCKQECGDIAFEKMAVSLTALLQVGLIGVSWKPFRMKIMPKQKCDPMKTPVMQYLLSL